MTVTFSLKLIERVLVVKFGIKLKFGGAKPRDEVTDFEGKVRLG